MAQLGYSKSKYSQLTRNYLNEESREAALALWVSRQEKDKYGSVGISTYNHFKKGGGGPRGSIMGPCIQSVIYTYVKRDEKVVNVYYRTTEVFKKFPADLVWLREILLPEFGPVKRYDFHFANLTVHPMYWVVAAPHMVDPVAAVRRLKATDRYFHDWVVKWTARYICEEYNHGIAKFAQAMRVKIKALELLSPAKLKALQEYCRANHPGYSRTRFTHDEEEGND